MMIFITIFFIFFYIYSLIKGKLFYDTLLDAANWDVKKQKGEVKDIPQELGVKTVGITLLMLFYLIIEIAYLIKAISIDPYLYPTIFIIVYIFVNFVFNLSRSKKDLSSEIGQIKYLARASRKHSFKSIITQLVYLIYFVYMFAILVELI